MRVIHPNAVPLLKAQVVGDTGWILGDVGAEQRAASSGWLGDLSLAIVPKGCTIPGSHTMRVLAGSHAQQSC